MLLIFSFLDLVGPIASRQFLARGGPRKVRPPGGRCYRFFQSTTGSDSYSSTTSIAGEFLFSDIAPQDYVVSVSANGQTWKTTEPVLIQSGNSLIADLELSDQNQTVIVVAQATSVPQVSTNTSKLTSGEVSSLPLNERDFSKLLLLAAGTMTDTNGAANFTQQFRVNGLRGTASVFAMDGTDSSDPELGGATFSNFNVDAIQEVQSSSGVMPAEIGQGAAGFTNVVTKSETEQIHGSVFEFVRNAAFDARNFFDHESVVEPRRIPPFVRNEFGFTNGGPVVLPGVYDGRGKTFYFGEYQGFQQVLGTTQVFAVPTADERKGIDTTTFLGDTILRGYFLRMVMRELIPPTLPSRNLIPRGRPPVDLGQKP